MMMFRFLKGKYNWVLFLFYILLIFCLVQVEKNHVNANIKTMIDGFWYSVVTLTTVGYGDFYPVSNIGKAIGLIIIISSLGVLGILIGNITTIIQTQMEKKKKGLFGTDFHNHFIIIGWDDFARNVTDQIINAKSNVAIVTNSMTDLELIRETYSKEQVFVLFADYKNMDSLKKVNIEKANSVFVNFEEDANSLIYIINLKKQFEVNIVVALQTSELKETFKSVGVNHSVSKNDITAKMVASFIFEPDVALFTEDLMETSVKDDDFDINQFKVIEGNPFLSKKYIDAFIGLKKEYDTILIGLVKINGSTRTLLKNPSEDTIISLGDYMLTISNNKALQRLTKVFGVNEGIN
ncbi:MAG: potassium channel protein [Flavobacteriaceae bacterium]|nr:potassium channel protein [Flavobacteriaceae bacterium]